MAERMEQFFNVRAAGYDDHMRAHVERFEAFYAAVAEAVPRSKQEIDLLDLGIGTGLELPAILRRLPNARITGIDVSCEMLRQLHGKYPKRELRLIEGSFTQIDLGRSEADVVVSTMALHHWLPEAKASIYRRIAEVLRPGGCFVNGDYIERFEESNRRIEAYLSRSDLGRELHHFDLPLTVEDEIQLLQNAGLGRIRIPYRTSRAAVFVSHRPSSRVSSIG